MKSRVRLFGTLGQAFPGYNHSEGIVVEIPDRATVRDLLAHLELSEYRGVAVVVEGHILRAEDEIPPEVSVSVLQAIGGG
ncbi:MAG: MoaD/ThiS family protein [Anaerolineae bacterium]|jgi:sulfur carrier protein ThiS